LLASSFIISTSHSAFAAFVLHWLIVLVITARVLLKRKPTGVALAWIVITLSIPFGGAIAYVLVGELWLPRRRIKRYLAYTEYVADRIQQIDRDWDIKGDQLAPIAAMLNAQTIKLLSISAIGGNDVKIIPSSQECIESILRDIEAAESSINMLFYIWHSAGLVVEVEEALIRASARGVTCRLMLDGSGSKDFLRSDRPNQLREAGIEITEVLPVGMMRNVFRRLDIRNHRKIIAIDHHTAYTGSMNMADPAFFGSLKGVGMWIDIMARVQGPAAQVLDIVTELDRAVEFGENPTNNQPPLRPDQPLQIYGQVPLQVVPSGPGQSPRITHDMLMTLIYNTTKKLVITTPYFIPSEAMLEGLTAAALRGVQVTIVVPQDVDSVLVRHASKSYFQDLLDVGVHIHQFTGGLLHTKTVTADDQVALIGTVNMDKRSFWINFEISLFAYDQAIVQELCALQNEYIARSHTVDAEQWKNRPFGRRLLENSLQLLAPIL